MSTLILIMRNDMNVVVGIRFVYQMLSTHIDIIMNTPYVLECLEETDRLQLSRHAEKPY